MFPSVFVIVDGKKVVVDYRLFEECTTANVPGEVVSGVYRTEHNAEVVDVEPIADPQFRSRVVEELKSRKPKLASVYFWEA